MACSANTKVVSGCSMLRPKLFNAEILLVSLRLVDNTFFRLSMLYVWMVCPAQIRAIEFIKSIETTSLLRSIRCCLLEADKLTNSNILPMHALSYHPDNL